MGPATNGKHAIRIEPVLYTLVAALITLIVAARFYGSLRLQTLYALHWSQPHAFGRLAAEGRGPWSAPLDDVFIHFDFARSAARGHPFEWSEGNGFSSGGTSVLYPLVLAVGYWLGFRNLSLMEWAALLAMVCTFGFLLAARRFARHLPQAATYLLPCVILSVGALDWSLFSGMEVALFLALWALAYIASDDIHAHELEDPRSRTVQRAALLGVVSALVVATRPEAITSVFVLAVAAVAGTKYRDVRRSATVLGLALTPAAAVLVAQSLANRWFTGESSAAGALVKLEINHPYLDARQIFESWIFFIKYQVLRVTQYHFGDRAAYGWIVWALAAAALGFTRTRRAALILWASAFAWVLVVALNGQVRWQNERYTMPAVAWLLATAALGAGALFTRAFELRARIRGPVMGLATAAALALFVVHQAPRFREQLWFFGRASRNIFDQHVQVGLELKYALNPPPKRVLVGDAGAIPYVSDLPALDLIGLGGYHDLPFARASRAHVGAALELIERMIPEERPDVLAIYPSWWGEFPLWFGREIGRVPVRGNVICGGASKVLYRADWSSLSASGRPFSLRPGERVIDAVDPADLVNERQHRYRIDGAPGFVSMKLLAEAGDGHPLWDAGRSVPPNARESFDISGLEPGKRFRLLVRAAPTAATHLELTMDGRAAGAITLPASDVWQEVAFDDLQVRGTRVRIELGASDRERISYHLFVVTDAHRPP